jgi:hypothetical protein
MTRACCRLCKGGGGPIPSSQPQHLSPNHTTVRRAFSRLPYLSPVMRFAPPSVVYPRVLLRACGRRTLPIAAPLSRRHLNTKETQSRRCRSSATSTSTRRGTAARPSLTPPRSTPSSGSTACASRRSPRRCVRPLKDSKEKKTHAGRVRVLSANNAFSCLHLRSASPLRTARADLSVDAEHGGHAPQRAGLAALPR